ncbi:hypothetical protein BDZ45DRAFT_59671 [Acephala macrosclerotiorum]|nr:hypothetical protein BDZ45DRAFT_59671 [Acephala macrosclerotiorum]
MSTKMGQAVACQWKSCNRLQYLRKRSDYEFVPPSKCINWHQADSFDLEANKSLFSPSQPNTIRSCFNFPKTSPIVLFRLTITKMLTTHVLLLALVTLAAAFQVPEGTVDGFYKAYYNSAGLGIHEPVLPGTLPLPNHNPISPKMTKRAPSLPAAVTPNRRSNPDDFWEVWCGWGLTVDHGNCHAAVQDLKNQLETETCMEAHQAYYSIRGNLVAYACNLSNGPAVVGMG